MWRVKRLLLRGGGTLEALLKPFLNGKHKGFTLAEMMVVMLILSIVLAAMAPVVTTRSKVDQSSPWRYSEGNLSDAYYGLGESQIAMIGQREFNNTDETAKLIINSSSTRPSHIAFKRDGSNQGLLRLTDSSILLGSLSNTGSLGVYSVGLGSGVNTSNYSVALGRFSNVIGDYSTAIGHSSAVSGTHSIAIGYESEAGCNDSMAIGDNATTNGLYSIALGNASQSSVLYGIAVGRSSVVSGDYGTAIGGSSRVSAQLGTAIGYSSEASSSESTALGYNSMASGLQSTALGSGSDASGRQSTAVGINSEANGDYSTAVGVASVANEDYSTAIGRSSKVLGEYGVALGYDSEAGLSGTTLGTESEAVGNFATALGYWSKAQGNYSTALGEATIATGATSTAIGAWAEAKGENNTAIGFNACKGVTGSNKVCIGANSGPKSGVSWATDNVERIFIGSTSKYNDGAAVLEVHNGSSEYSISKSRTAKETAVVVNGMLVVKGGIITSVPELGSNAHEATGTADAALLGHDDGSSAIRTANNSNSNKYNEYFHKYGKFLNPGTTSAANLLSDRRLKYVGKEFTSGLDKIRELKVFNYTFKKDETKTPHVGVIAQDLQKIFPDAVKKGADGFLQIRMEDMFYAVINAVKELDSRVTALEKENAELKARLERLEAKIK